MLIVGGLTLLLVAYYTVGGGGGFWVCDLFVGSKVFGENAEWMVSIDSRSFP